MRAHWPILGGAHRTATALRPGSGHRTETSSKYAISAMAAGVVALLTLAPVSASAFSAFELRNADETAMHSGSFGRSSSQPHVRIHKMESGEQIHLDGKLDDRAWDSAVPASGFSVWDPDRGKAPSEETVFKVAYDDHAVYFGIACHEDDPSAITKTLSRRDTFSNSDLVSVYIDPYFDKTTGYNFRVNPLGVQEDAYMYDDGERDADWDAVWQAETFEDENGWYAEMRIPFSSIRYRPDSPEWGLQVYRYMHGRGEDTSWATWDRDTSGFVSRFGVLEGFESVPAPRQLEIWPYVVGRVTDPSSSLENEDKDDFENFGADIKYGVTADLTLNATLQPDFGQVEADPAVLNLSPFETQFSEKRPFFVEGSRFFQMPDFNLFYSRRIGTGESTSRIRAATKLTGKTRGDISVAALYATTDVTQPGQSHNFLKEGEQSSHYAVTRLGKEWADGRIRVNAMQTAVMKGTDRNEFGNPGGSFADRSTREAYTTGVDLAFQTPSRTYRTSASFVGSIVDHEDYVDDERMIRPATVYGTGGELDFSKSGGTWNYSTWARWESDKLDLNDAGFLGSPDEMNTGLWIGYRYNPDGKSNVFNRANINLNLSQAWLYAERTGYDIHDTSEVAWSYGRGHQTFLNSNMNGWMQFKNYMEAWWGVAAIPDGTQRYETRSTVLLDDGDRVAIPGGGPLMAEPETYGVWWGTGSDSRKPFTLIYEGSNYWDRASNYTFSSDIGVHWTQSASMNHQVDVGFRYRRDDTQHIENFEAQSGGIGGVDYVFGQILQRTVDLTLRTNVLFSRTLSLELYAQPFITTGNYSNPRSLRVADSYKFDPFQRDGFDVRDSDFTFASLNVNLVGRWEYRPGSTFFLVWSQNRNRYDERGFGDANFDNSIGTDPIFGREPENIFLAKVTYWLPL